MRCRVSGRSGTKTVRGVHRASKTRPPPDPWPQLKHHYSYRRWTYSIGRSARPVALAATAPVRPPAGSPCPAVSRRPCRPARARPASCRGVAVSVAQGAVSAAGLPAPRVSGGKVDDREGREPCHSSAKRKNFEGFRVAGRRGGRAPSLSRRPAVCRFGGRLSGPGGVLGVRVYRVAVSLPSHYTPA